MSDSQEQTQSENREAHNNEQETAQVTDASILHPSLAKEQLRTVALQRLGEVRSQLARVQNQLDSSNREKSILMAKWMEEVEANKANTSLYNDVVSELREKVPSPPPSQSQIPTEQTPLQPSRTRVPEPDKFTGSDRIHNIENFLVAVERFLRLSRIDQSDKIDTAAGFFSGVALDWWISVERTEGEKIRNIGWEEFRQLCLKRFMAVTNAETAMKKIGKWKQSGSINSYIASFQNLVQQIPTNLLPQQARLLYFIDGLTTDLQKHVKSMRPESVEDAINFAQSIGNVGYTQGGMNYNNRYNQSYSHSQRQPQQQSHNYNNHSVGTRNQPIYLENVNTEVSEVDSGVVASSPSLHMRVTSPDFQSTSYSGVDLSYLTAEQRKLFGEGRCFKCKQIGHRQSSCPNKQRFSREKKD